jgi:ribosomal protein S18
MKKILLLLLLVVFFSTSSSSQIPVILRVSASEQMDTTGCNFVRELTRITYGAIMSGKVKLWNAPAKELFFVPQTLKEIEQSTRTNFMDQDVVFIYEYWTNSNKILSSRTTGFLFSNKNQSGEDVEYGYVDFEDMQSVLLSERVMSNANGNFNSNLSAYIASKNYNFNFLQFAGKVINNKEDSRKIFSEYIGSSKFNLSQFSSNEIPQKKVTWTIDASQDITKVKSQNSTKVLVAIEKYLRQNEEVFFNLGGEKILTHVQKGKWKVTRLEMNELWKKIDGVISFDPLSMTIFINDSALSEVPYRDMVKMDIKVNEMPFLDFLKQQNFNYIIRSINTQDIPRSESYAYQKALFETDWKRLTSFVAQF